jgi:hypothetical protein
MQAKFQTDLQLEKNHSLEANNKLLQKDLEAEQTRRWLYLTGAIALLVLVLMALRNYRITAKLQRTKLQSLEAEKT